MVSSTQRHGELIADLAPQRAALGKSQMVGIGGLSTTNQARMLGDRSDVIPVTNAARLRQRQHALVDRLRSQPGLWLYCAPLISSMRHYRMWHLRRRRKGQSGRLN